MSIVRTYITVVQVQDLYSTVVDQVVSIVFRPPPKPRNTRIEQYDDVECKIYQIFFIMNLKCWAGLSTFAVLFYCDRCVGRVMQGSVSCACG